eukprot:9778289-Alexandrium_andersonii.AAC.1
MRQLESVHGLRRTTFPQCVYGPESKKLTTLWGNLGWQSFFTKDCCHRGHPPLAGVGPDGHFRTRVAQAYPSEFRKELAAAF